MELQQPIPIAGEPDWEWRVARLFPPRGKWSEADYLHLPDNRGVELANGCLEFLPMPNEEHQLIAAFLYRALYEYSQQQRLGLALFAGIPVRTEPEKMRQPDIAYLTREKAGARKGRFWDGADLVVEVVSPSPDDRKRDLKDKREEYAQGSIPEYWIVDPQDGSITVLALEGAAYREHGTFRAGSEAASLRLPGFTVAVDAVFAAAEVAFE
jgi:Uma2 family endonuclease